MAEKKEGKKFGAGVVKYFKDVKSELKKVVWPTFKQIKNNTIIVIVAVIVVGALIWALDFGFGTGLDYAIGKINGTDAIDASQLDASGIDMNGIQMVDENGNPIDANVVTEGAEIPAEGEEAPVEGEEVVEEPAAEETAAEEPAAEEAAVEEPVAEEAADENAGADSDGE